MERQKKLFVGALPKNLEDQKLREYFSDFGEVDKAYVVKDFKTGKTRGFGFVVFKNEEDIQKVLNLEGKLNIDGKQIHVRRNDKLDP
jgi:RNA recognition motif-containing protein